MREKNRFLFSRKRQWAFSRMADQCFEIHRGIWKCDLYYLSSMFSSGGSLNGRLCPSGSIKYFRFEPPRGGGFGGKRAYGQDVEFDKSVKILIAGKEVTVDHVDAELTMPMESHDLGDGMVLVTSVEQ